MIQIAVERAELDLEKSILNLNEVEASGEIPRNILSAPVVRGFDYVSERLKIKIKEIELDLNLLMSRLGRFKQLVENHSARGEELNHIQAEIAARNVMIDNVKKRLDLRKRFIMGEITAQEVEIKDRITVVERKLHLAQSKVDSLSEQLKRLKTLETREMISPMEVKQLQFALDATQAKVKLATLELDILRKIK